MIGLRVNSKRVYTKEGWGVFPAWSCRCPCPCGKPLLIHACTGDPPALASHFDSAGKDHCSFPLSLEVCKVFVFALQGWSLCFPQSCGSLLIKSHWPSETNSLGFLIPLPDPQAGNPDVGFRTSQQRENLFGIILDHPPSGYGIWFYCDFSPPTVSLRLLCLWGIFFWWVPASSCWWLFSSSLQFCCSCSRKWAHILLLAILKQKPTFPFLLT